MSPAKFPNLDIAVGLDDHLRAWFEHASRLAPSRSSVERSETVETTPMSSTATPQIIGHTTARANSATPAVLRVRRQDVVHRAVQPNSTVNQPYRAITHGRDRSAAMTDEHERSGVVH